MYFICMSSLTFVVLVFVHFQNGGEFAIVPPVEGTQPVEIFEPVVLLPKELYVPWDPVKQPVHYQMTVSS